MQRFLTTTCLALAILAVAAAGVHAQYTVYYPAPVVINPPPVVTTSYYAPPVTTYYAPPVTTYYAPPTVFYPPTTVYYPPAYTSYYPATTVYSAPLLAAPSVVTTRTFVGLGIFRPRGVYTQTYVSPSVSFAPRATYYTPYYLR